MDMTRIFLTGFLFLFSTLAVIAQNSFNLLIGPSMDWYKVKELAIINKTPSTQNVSGLGFAAKLVYEYQKNTYIGFGSELEFSQTNAGIYRNYDIVGNHVNFQDSLFTHTIKMNSINVPLFVKIRLFNGHYNVSYSYFHFGPGMQYLLSSSRKVEVSNPGYSSQYPKTSGDIIFQKNLEPYFLGAFGRVILTKRYIFIAELAYKPGLGNWGFLAYRDKEDKQVIDYFKRNSLTFQVGIRLRNYHQPGCHEF